jgi:hypothetical protein
MPASIPQQARIHASHLIQWLMAKQQLVFVSSRLSLRRPPLFEGLRRLCVVGLDLQDTSSSVQLLLAGSGIFAAQVFGAHTPTSQAQKHLPHHFF